MSGEPPEPDDARLDDPRLDGAAPTLPVARNRWTAPLGAVGAGVLGLLVFSGLSQGRAATRSLLTPDGDAAPSSMADLPPPGMDAPAPAPKPVAGPTLRASPAVVVGAPAAFAPAPDLSGGDRSPTLVVDLSTPDDETAVKNAARAIAAAKGAGAGGAAAPGGDKSQDRQSINERFAAAVDGEQVETVRASALHAPGSMILQGTVIPAVLETALNTDIPGWLRAVVAQDVRSFDGSQVLIPRGSRLIGQYRSGVARGQSRAFVVWSRLIRPDGASVMLGSPGGDALGRAGLTGKVDNHFFRQFGSAILLSVITAGSNALANNSNATLVIGSNSSSEGPPALKFLDKETDIPPTVKVPQGAPMTIFVAKDLDFADVSR